MARAIPQHRAPSTGVLIAALLLALLIVVVKASSGIQLEPFDLEDVALEGESLHKAHAKLNEECVWLVCCVLWAFLIALMRPPS